MCFQSRLTSTFAERLEKAQVVSSNPRIDIPNACTNLVELNFTFKKDKGTDLVEIYIRWDKIGSKLKKLNILIL